MKNHDTNEISSGLPVEFCTHRLLIVQKKKPDNDRVEPVNNSFRIENHFYTLIVLRVALEKRVLINSKAEKLNI